MAASDILDDQKLDEANASNPALSLVSNTVEKDPALVAQDDVFFPNASSIDNIDDYKQIKDALSWTSVSYFWPDADQADWVVLGGKTFLSSDTPTIAVIQGESADITVTSGQNLIFFSGTSLKIRQTGGAAEVFFDPLKEASVELDYFEGATSFSYLTELAPQKSELMNEDGSRTITTGNLSLTYNTAETSRVFIQDLITGEVSRAVATNTVSKLSELPKFEELPQPQGNSDIPKAGGGVSAPISTEPSALYQKTVEDVDEAEERELRKEAQAEEDEALFEDDVLIAREPTDIVKQYFDYAPTASWKYSVDEYVTPNDYNFTVDGQKRDVDIARSEKVYADVKEQITDHFNELFASNDWTDFLASDILDVFYAD